MSLFKNGIFLLRNLPSVHIFYQSLAEASKHVEENLYIDFLSKDFQEGHLQTSNHTFQELIAMVYNRPRNICSALDVHVLLPPARNYNCLPRKTLNPLEGCILAEPLRPKQNELNEIIQSLYDFNKFSVEYISTESECSEPLCKKSCDETRSCDGVVIGGTFDQIHDGHRFLIATALLLANEKFTCGVAEGPLLERKILKELIETVDVRIANVEKMVEDYKPGLKHKIVPLTDTCGPSGTDGDLQVLVVSDETAKAGPFVNETRKSNGLHPLQVISINLVEDSPDDLSECLNEEGKVSSSAGRVRLLGRLRKEPNFSKRGNCYVIGVTGGIASGKSSVVKRLEAFGAYTIDCDKLGHEAYLPGRTAYHKIVDHFGDGVLNEDGSIDRRKLGPIVFADKKELNMLNEIVWPEIRQMMMDIIEKVKQEGVYDIIIYEAAIIFESGWDADANEIWSCVVPTQEAVKRIVERNSLTEEQARCRISAQMGNKERVERSHVVLSTLWEREFTQKQVEKAWNALKERICLQDSQSHI